MDSTYLGYQQPPNGWRRYRHLRDWRLKQGGMDKSWSESDGKQVE